MIGKIIRIKKLCYNVISFEVELPSRISFDPGQFIHVKCDETLFLRRPFAIVDVSDKTLRFVFQVISESTSKLSNKSVGDAIDLLGPLGKGFDVSKCSGKIPIIVAGGIGVTALVELAKVLGNSVVYLGFKTQNDVIFEDEFKNNSVGLKIASEDGACDFKGNVLQLLEEYVKINSDVFLYACGPTKMLIALSKICERYSLGCEISVEEKMACGIGTCLGCVCKNREDRYVRVCRDGPVFDIRDVKFD